MAEYVLGSMFGYTFFVETTTNQAMHGHVYVTDKYEIPTTADAWSASDKTSGVTLSNSDKTATFAGGATRGVRSTTKYASATAGKYYAELLLTTINSGDLYGIQNSTGSRTNTATGTGISADGDVWHLDDGPEASLGSLSSGDVICIAWDAGAEDIWFRKNSGNWNGSGTANPATGTEGIDTSAAANVSHALWHYYSDGGTAVTTIRTELAEYTQTIPSGFNSWMDETTVTHYTYVKHAGTWKQASTFVKHSGTWKPATTWVKSGGTWKQA